VGGTQGRKERTTTLTGLKRSRQRRRSRKKRNSLTKVSQPKRIRPRDGEKKADKELNGGGRRELGIAGRSTFGRGRRSRRKGWIGKSIQSVNDTIHSRRGQGVGLKGEGRERKNRGGGGTRKGFFLRMTPLGKKKKEGRKHSCKGELMASGSPSEGPEEL